MPSSGAQDVGVNWTAPVIAGEEDYGKRIKPSVSVARGSGSRRLYNILNVYEIAIALLLLETGLRPAVVGDVIGQIHAEVTLRKKLTAAAQSDEEFYLLIGRQPNVGKRWREKRFQILDFVVHGDLLLAVDEELGRERKCNLSVVDVGPIFKDIRERRKEMRSAQDRGEV